MDRDREVVAVLEAETDHQREVGALDMGLKGFALDDLVAHVVPLVVRRIGCRASETGKGRRRIPICIALVAWTGTGVVGMGLAGELQEQG